MISGTSRNYYGGANDSPTRSCSRCPQLIASDSRPGGMCMDCYSVTLLTGKVATCGVDLATVDDDLLNRIATEPGFAGKLQKRRKRVMEKEAA